MDHRPSQMSYTDLLNEVDSNMIVRNLGDTFAQAKETPPTTPNTTTSKKPTTRGTSFSAHEDMLIVSAWLNISQDAIVGNEQRQGSYWQRIYEYYTTHKNFESNRTKSAIRNRWGVISTAVSKFCGCVSQIERLHQSGVTENDKINSARTVYADNNKAQFNLDHCWNILRYEQKWVHSLESPKKKVKNASTSESVNFEEGVSEASLADVDERPPGRKAEKARLHKRKGMSEDNGEIKAILQVLQENKIKMHDERMEMQKKQALQNGERLAQERVRNEQRATKLAQEGRRDDERILLVDTTGMPTHIAAWYQLKQKEILERDGVL